MISLVGEVMGPPPAMVPPSTSYRALTELMTSLQPVVLVRNREKVLGIISRANLI